MSRPRTRRSCSTASRGRGSCQRSGDLLIGRFVNGIAARVQVLVVHSPPLSFRTLASPPFSARARARKGKICIWPANISNGTNGIRRGLNPFQARRRPSHSVVGEQARQVSSGGRVPPRCDLRLRHGAQPVGASSSSTSLLPFVPFVKYLANVSISTRVQAETDKMKIAVSEAHEV